MTAVAASPAVPAGPIERLLAQVEIRPDAPAIEMEASGQVLSYRGLQGLIEDVRAALQALGVGEGDAVLVALPACPELVAAFYALASLSALFVPVAEDLTPFELAPVLADARPKGVIVAEAGMLARVLGPSVGFALLLQGQAPVVQAIDGVRVAVLAQWVGQQQGRRCALQPPPGNPLVSCHFTYKGLGYPLGVLHRYASYGACIEGLLASAGVRAGSVHLALLPLHPIYALLASVLSPLSLGAHVIVVTGSGRRHVLALLGRRQVECASLVPTIYRLLVAQARSPGRHKAGALHPELLLVTGGSHMSPEAMAEVEEAVGVRPSQGYGLTEALLVCANFRGSAQPHSLGLPLQGGLRGGVQVAVLDAQGQPLPAGRVGEIVVSGPCLMQGYLGRPRETARFLKGGRMHTGDLGHLDAQGYLHFDGRAMPFTKSAAQMVDLPEIEAVLRRHPLVADARASVRNDPLRGERVDASVVLRAGAAIQGEDLVTFARGYLSPHKVPRSVRLFQRGLVATGAQDFQESA